MRRVFEALPTASLVLRHGSSCVFALSLLHPRAHRYPLPRTVDDFRCDVCSARRRSDTPPPYSVHVHTHPVVLCKPAPPPSPAPTPPASRTPSPPPPSLPDVASVASRLAAVEGRVGQLDALQSQYGAVGERLEQLDELMGQIVQIRDMMTTLLALQQAGMASSEVGRSV